MQDPFGREITSMRVSVTQKCNLNCFYCHREGYYSRSENVLTAAEIGRLAALAAKLGITSVKLTGGEPLVRSDIVEVVAQVASSIPETSLTTNGILLERYAEQLRAAGLKRVNISFNSLNPAVYEQLTGHAALDAVIDGVRAAVAAGLAPVKLNMVVFKTINDRELEDMFAFAARMGTVLQLIEFENGMDWINGEYFKKYHDDLSAIEAMLETRASAITERALHHRKRYRIHVSNGDPGYSSDIEVELVRPMHNREFCRYCTRLRITADGQLKPCLMNNDGLVELLALLRNGADNNELEERFMMALQCRKPYWQ